MNTVVKLKYLHVGQIPLVFSLFTAHTYFKDIQVTFDFYHHTKG